MLEKLLISMVIAFGVSEEEMCIMVILRQIQKVNTHGSIAFDVEPQGT